MAKKEITRDSILGEIIKDNPKAEGILGVNGVPCMSCPMGKMEIDALRLGDVAQKYGLDLDKILKDLNK